MSDDIKYRGGGQWSVIIGGVTYDVQGEHEARAIAAAVKALHAEIEKLRNELRHLQRKVDHGCAGFYCEDCDKGSEVSDE